MLTHMGVFEACSDFNIVFDFKQAFFGWFGFFFQQKLFIFLWAQANDACFATCPSHPLAISKSYTC